MWREKLNKRRGVYSSIHGITAFMTIKLNLKGEPPVHDCSKGERWHTHQSQAKRLACGMDKPQKLNLT